ncbi:hypothetical protein A1355_15440 [Methylomonas koyamae]|uniref:Uncharacterized protein n=1 Tax=Methylomonas koyamae TaxID=702114 RepID=A0A177N3F5_9GAMM|nr:hypothetical protein A1355_15440 [Methylomonas koyamae]
MPPSLTGTLRQRIYEQIGSANLPTVKIRVGTKTVPTQANRSFESGKSVRKKMRLSKAGHRHIRLVWLRPCTGYQLDQQGINKQ